MRLIDNILWLDYADLVDAGVSASTINSAKLRQNNGWEFLEDPKDKRKVLVQYEPLVQKYKDLLKDKYGDVYDYVAKEPIKAMVKQDLKAEQFYLEFTYGDNKQLSREHVEKYTRCANWLNMIVEATKDKRELKATLGLKIDQFYMHVMQLFVTENIDLPKSYKRLVADENSALKKYLRDSYASLISPHFGNKKSAKVVDELSESVLLELISHPNQYDAVIISQLYNTWAIQNGYATITDKTVLIHKNKNLDEITMEREGIAAFKDKVSRKIKGSRPSAPMLLVEHDDNHLDLFFQDERSKFNRPQAIVVMDSYNNYVLGYAYVFGPITTEVVLAAYVDAMYHIRALTGGWYLPFEIKADKWAHATLTPFYEDIATYIPARLGNKHRGYIEQFFGTNHWKNCMKLGAINYSGNNITATNRGVNADYLSKNQQLRPFVGSGKNEQVEEFFSRLRFLKQKNGLSKHEEWLEAWNKMPEEKKRPISDEQFLMKFGVHAKHRGNGVRLTTKGVSFQLDNKVYNYEPVVYRQDLLGASLEVVYDINDMSRVLLTDNDKIRLIARDARVSPRALADHTTDSLSYLRELQKEQNEHLVKVATNISQRKEVIRKHRIDTEAILQAGVQQKAIMKKAESDYYDEFVELPAHVEREDEEEYNPFSKL